MFSTTRYTKPPAAPSRFVQKNRQTRRNPNRRHPAVWWWQRTERQVSDRDGEEVDERQASAGAAGEGFT